MTIWNVASFVVTAALDNSSVTKLLPICNWRQPRLPLKNLILILIYLLPAYKKRRGFGSRLVPRRSRLGQRPNPPLRAFVPLFEAVMVPPGHGGFFLLRDRFHRQQDSRRANRQK